MSETLARDEELVAFIRQAKDRQEILDCLYRYARGVDRRDRALVLSAYHADAVDQHGIVELGAEAFSDWVVSDSRGHQIKYQHHIVNHTVELDGATAHAETYYIYWGEHREGPPPLCFGRYIDRFEKRDGRWAIAHRVCLVEMIGQFAKADVPAEFARLAFSTGPSTSNKSDLSYVRPLLTSSSGATTSSSTPSLVAAR